MIDYKKVGEHVEEIKKLLPEWKRHQYGNSSDGLMTNCWYHIDQLIVSLSGHKNRAEVSQQEEIERLKNQF